MSFTNNFIFNCLRVIVWMIFIGLSIEAGGYLTNFIFSIYKPEFIPNLYQKMDLMSIYSVSKSAFYGVYSFILVMCILKAYLFYIVIMLTMKMDLKKPFSAYVSDQIFKITYFTLAIGMLGLVATQFVRHLAKRGMNTDVLDNFWVDSEAFFFMGAVVYIIGTIFKKGLEIQNENDLTV